MLSALITSRSRVELLAWFFTHPGERFHYMQLSKLLKASRPSIQRELKRLEEAGILVSQKEANVRFYTVDQDHLLYPELKAIVFKTLGVSDRLRRSLSKLGDIRAAFIYGSVAKDQEDARSDIDLTIIGDVDPETLHDTISAAEAELGREVNYVVYAPDEWRERRAADNAFVTDVAGGPKIFLVGDEDALR